MKSKLQQQETAAALTQHLEPYVASHKPAKAIANTLNKLAKQLVQQQQQQQKSDAKATAKASREALTQELMALLVPQSGQVPEVEAKTVKSLAKTVAQLAKQLLKQQLKQQKRAAKAAATEAQADEEAVALVKASAARPRPMRVASGSKPSAPKMDNVASVIVEGE